jgi:hypothetical protein
VTFVPVYNAIPGNEAENLRWLRRASADGCTAVILCLPPGVTRRTIEEALADANLRTEPEVRA